MEAPNDSVGSGPDARDFVRRFGEFWSAPSRDRLAVVLGPDVELIAPMTPRTRGFDHGWRTFADLLELIPDLGATVHRWGRTDDGVLIEFTLAGTVGGRPISWDAVDRFVVDDAGLATVRISYFDSAPLAFALLSRPRAWMPFARAQAARLRR
ncbi:MAG: nuclear transport factor 2 family protein [Solirubrobacterales bacterium]|nr:nuclear transport factor 2 family protein [Solirubrobacterales bacterium]